MAINTGSPAIIETNATTNASETLNSEKPSKRRKRKAIKTKDEVVVDQGIGSKAVQNASPGVPVTQSCTTPGTLHTRSGRLPKSGQYPMVFEPDMMLSVHHEETVKETPWLSDDLQERALLQLEVLLETHKKLRGNAVRYRLSIRRLQPVPMKLTDAIFDVYSWLRTWTTLFELTGDNVNYEGASKILDWHWRVCQIMQSSEGDESVGILSSKVGSDVPTKGHEQQHLPCQDKMTSVRFREEASIEAAVANRDISVSTGDTGSISGSGARDSRLEIGQASLSSEKPTMDPSPGQIQVPFQLPKDQLIMLNRKCPPNLPTVHVERVMKLKPTLVYFSELSDCEKATVVCETAQRWISDGSKQLGAKEVKSLSYLITTMHDFMARQNFGRALQSAGILHGAVIDEVAKMPTRLRRLIFMMWAKYWIGTSFNEPEPTVATSLRLTMMSMCGPKRIGPGVAS